MCGKEKKEKDEEEVEEDEGVAGEMGSSLIAYS